MISMKELAEKVQSTLVEGNVGTYYHGSTHKLTTFVTDFMDGNENNHMYGPGIYFTSNPKEAAGYADKNGYVYEVQLNFRKELSTKGKVNVNVLKRLMMNSPDEDAWTNWGENKNQAIQLALQTTLSSSDNMLEALLNVWGDWYRGEHIAFATELTKLGYDGTLYPNINGSGNDWAVVYNPASIQLIKIIPSNNYY